jgi:hypothetical protein
MYEPKMQLIIKYNVINRKIYTGADLGRENHDSIPRSCDQGVVGTT